MTSFWDKEELIGKNTKNNREEIQVKQVAKRGKEYVDIRVFWYDSAEDVYKPSQKGIAVPLDALAELKMLLEKIST